MYALRLHSRFWYHPNEADPLKFFETLFSLLLPKILSGRTDTTLGYPVFATPNTLELFSGLFAPCQHSAQPHAPPQSNSSHRSKLWVQNEAEKQNTKTNYKAVSTFKGSTDRKGDAEDCSVNRWQPCPRVRWKSGKAEWL